MQAASRRTSTELTEFTDPVQSERASNVDQKSTQRRHDAAERSLGKSRFGEFGVQLELRVIRQPLAFKVTDVGTNRKPVCDFLLTINTH